jgi:hypothetical protein
MSTAIHLTPSASAIILAQLNSQLLGKSGSEARL